MRGVEIEGKFQLLDRLSMITSYAYTDSEITKDNPGSAGSSNEGNHAAFVPRDQASLWADYGLGGDFAGLNLGGGIRYVGRTWGNNANTTEIPGYSVTDFAVRYDLGRRNRSLQGLLLALNISNLFDKHYVSTCLSTTTACYWGEGRKLSGTLNYRW
jgi:iron complex outermembrane receptor protein